MEEKKAVKKPNWAEAELGKRGHSLRCTRQNIFEHMFWNEVKEK